LLRGLLGSTPLNGGEVKKTRVHGTIYETPVT
jgi:hypothetical protein